MTMPESKFDRPVRPAEAILADIWDALWRVDTIRSTDLSSISIAVRDGTVTLAGHIIKDYHRRLLEEIVRSVPGVEAVQNEVVVDRDLVVQVAQALARDERTRPFHLLVSASRGWVSLDGVVPTRQVQLAAEEVAGRLPAVRGVVGLPRVAGESPEAPRRPIQPRIGSTVYVRNGPVGQVSQVVIHPANRLVTHAVVRAGEPGSAGAARPEVVVPAEAIALVKPESLFLQRNGPPLEAYPALDADHFPLAPSSWKAPYPYLAGEVRWPARQALAREGQPQAEPVAESEPAQDREAAPLAADPT